MKKLYIFYIVLFLSFILIISAGLYVIDRRAVDRNTGITYKTSTPTKYISTPIATPEPTSTPTPTSTPEPTAEPTAEPTSTPTQAPTATPTAVPTPKPTPTVTPVVYIIKDYTQEDLYLISKVVMAEAGDQINKYGKEEGTYGLRLVIDTVLNRQRDYGSVSATIYANSTYYKNGKYYTEYQFTCVADGNLDRAWVSTEIYNLVIEEIKNQTNTDVWFFNTHGFASYGKDLFKVGDHYFSAKK